MHTLIRRVGFGSGLPTESTSLVLALVMAELFYKFHSFTLECGAFLATWWVISYFASRARQFRTAKPDSGA